LPVPNIIVRLKILEKTFNEKGLNWPNWQHLYESLIFGDFVSAKKEARGLFNKCSQEVF
jgi:hypothetical protein